MSSSRVFSGSVERLYSEDDYPDSEGALGELLLGGESVVRDSCERHLILRLGPVFSHHNGNVLSRLLDQLMQGGTVLLESNMRGSPVAAEDAARVVSALADQLSTNADVWGIYHYCSSDITNCYEFAEVLLASASQFSQFSSAAVGLQKPGESGAPLNLALDCTKINNTFAIQQMPWRNSVAGTVKNYFDLRSA